jgi:hypothetical protein
MPRSYRSRCHRRRKEYDFYYGTCFLTTPLGVQEVPPVTTTGNGAGVLSLAHCEEAVQFSIEIRDLTSVIQPLIGGQSAHFHLAAAGSNGPVVKSLDADWIIGGPGATFGTLCGVWSAEDTEPLTPALVADLKAGNIYLNVHTADFVSGEVRGQVIQQVVSQSSGSSSNCSW